MVLLGGLVYIEVALYGVCTVAPANMNAGEIEYNIVRWKNVMKKNRLYHLVAEKIKTQISEGIYPPGSRLPGERELAEQFNVSRVTVREAEIALQALGYIDIKTGSGVYVLGPEAREDQGPRNICAFELTEARLMFESEAAALAARHIDDETLEHLESLLETMLNADPQCDDTALQADREFHLTIASASGNKAVKHVVENLWDLRTELPDVREAHAAICERESAAECHDEHLKVLLALRSRDPSAARQAMQEHFRSLLESLIDISEEQAREELRRKSTESRERFLNGATIGSPA